jgi:hypothetical protein
VGSSPASPVVMSPAVEKDLGISQGLELVLADRPSRKLGLPTRLTLPWGPGQDLLPLGSGRSWRASLVGERNGGRAG